MKFLFALTLTVVFVLFTIGDAKRHRGERVTDDAPTPTLKCQNGGVLENGVCKCRDNIFRGDRCEKYIRKRCGGNFGLCPKDWNALCIFQDDYCNVVDPLAKGCAGYCIPKQPIDWQEFTLKK